MAASDDSDDDDTEPELNPKRRAAPRPDASAVADPELLQEARDDDRGNKRCEGLR